MGLHRVTVKKWLQQEPLPDKVEKPVAAEKDVEPIPSPAPWSSWKEVHRVREALREHRFLFMRRPENLDEEDQRQMEMLLASPVGNRLEVVHSFMADWHRLWTDADGQRRSLAEAQTRYESWRTQEDYRAVPQLRRIQDQMTEAKFKHLSQFLHHPEWKATNNGAERAGRAFRHRQAPHFSLRKKEYIENSIDVAAYLHKEEATQPSIEPFHTCQRGRRQRKNVPG